MRTLIAGACFVGLVTGAQASTLTFDGLGLSDGDPIPQTYGDRIDDTPNVVVTYGMKTKDDASPEMNFHGSGFSDLTNIASADHVIDRFTVLLEADSGFYVTLAGFDLGNSGAAFSIDEISIVELPCRLCGASEVHSMNDVALPDSSDPHIHIDTSGLGVQATDIAIEFFVGGGAKIPQIGLDNISFTQAFGAPPPPPPSVPLPASLPLLAGAMGLYGVLRRRRS